MFELSVSFSLFNKVCVLECCEALVVFGMVDPEDEVVKERLKKAVRAWYGQKNDGENVPSGDELCLFEKVSEEELKKYISFKYGEESGEGEEFSRTRNGGSEEKAAVLLLNSLLTHACKSGATDIHIEEKLVRFRINGVLQKVCELSSEKSGELARRIKLLSKLDVMESRKGQDGQFVFEGETIVYVRVSCVPVVSGTVARSGETLESESIVLRLLDVNRVPLSLEKLGFSEEQCRELRKISRMKNGLVLLCGATGSGKSTTAASILSEIVSEEDLKRKIITIEDPPEYVLDGVTQIKVHREVGLGFSEALRLVFRQDPDVIFVGEIRDAESAETVVQAAGTGHLVFATVHASGIREAVFRLKNLGANLEEFSGVLRAIVYQELDCAGRFTRLRAEIHLPGERQL
ncbi:MAG: Flp pilus assembly complex ATPase component TadA [Treponema sp.]|nr:Flp pilus assembly complex ATPase component TadA [Candidatus Treponema equifaecale]